MEISPRKSSKRTQEHVDEWLLSQGYFRKHIPRDPTCLFRAISEQVYLTQYYHIRVRKECVDFMRENKNLFEKSITIPFDMYIEQMTCFTEAGGTNEIYAMSLLYKRDVFLFNGQKQICKQLTNYGFTNYLRLCYTPQKQYESVYSKHFVMEAGLCQSIMYEILYKDVFDMENLDYTVHKMLHDRNSTFRHDRFFSKGNLDMREELSAEIYKRLENTCEGLTEYFPKGVPPFPYRVAKAIDVNIYRNIDFDVWHEIRREVKNSGWLRYNGNGLQIGDKCLIDIDFDKVDMDKFITKAIKDNSSSIENQKYKKLCNASSSKTKERADCVDPYILEKHFDECSIDASKPSTSGTANMSTSLLATSTAATLMKITNIDCNDENTEEDLPELQWQKQKWKNQGQMVGENSSGKLQNYAANKKALQSQRQGDKDKKTSKTGKDDSQTVTGNTSSYYVASNDNSHPSVSYMPGYTSELIPANQMNRTLRNIDNLTQKSMDLSSCDLPLSDPATLKFFYNLGLECFRVNYAWNYGPTNGQLASPESWYTAGPSMASSNTSIMFCTMYNIYFVQCTSII